MIFWRALLRLCDAILTWMWYLLGIVLDALNPWISCTFSYPFFYDFFAWLTLYKASTRYGCSLFSTHDSLFCYIIPPENKPTSLLYGGTIHGYCSLAHEHLNLVSKFFLYVFTKKTQCFFTHHLALNLMKKPGFNIPPGMLRQFSSSLPVCWSVSNTHPK